MAGDEGDYARGYAVAQFREEMPTPPPPGFTSPFRSMEEWLMKIIATDQPEKKIAEYSFIFCGSAVNYLLGLAGYNTYRDGAGEMRKIDFKPTFMFFALPKDVYGHLPMMQAHERVVNELVAFTKTAVFQNSFLAAGGFISINLFGEIWPHLQPETW